MASHKGSMQAREVCLLGCTLLSALVAFWEHRRRLRSDRDAQRSIEDAARSRKLRDEERTGRIRAEQALRQDQARASTDASTDQDAANQSDQKPFLFHPIGVFDSCYRQRCGTPRQSNLVSGSLAVLRCVRDLNPGAALQGLEAFSHVWVLYVFHENTNMLKESKTVSRRKQQQGRVPLWQGLCMKVAPPRCPELRVGVMACRTPHRPNPIGLSLARVMEVDAAHGKVVLGGLDVVDGTPCLDIKPYLPGFESIPTARIPAWVQRSYDEPMMTVGWLEVAAQQFANMLLPPDPIPLAPFKTAADLWAAIVDTLALDIRSPLQKQRHPNPGHLGQGAPFFSGDLWFHELHIMYSLLPTKAVEGPDEGPAASVRIDEILRRDPERIRKGVLVFIAQCEVSASLAQRGGAQFHSCPLAVREARKAHVEGSAWLNLWLIVGVWYGVWCKDIEDEKFPVIVKWLPASYQKKYLKIQPWFPWNFHVKAKPVTCGNCKKEAEVYCVDCKVVLCKFCATLLHHPDTKYEKHSLEDIVKPEDGVMPEVKIISPILLDMVLFASACFLFSGAGISAEYFSGTSYCPGLSRLRGWLVWMDANVFFYWKNELAQYCDWEDSYWRFFMDAWIRSVLTNTDSWILLIGSFIKAGSRAMFMRIIITPIAAHVYAVLAYIVRSVEFWLHKILYERLEGSDHTFTKILQMVQQIKFAQKLGITDTSVKLLAALFLRIFCIIFGGETLLSVAYLLGFGNRAEQHQAWFTQMTGASINNGGANYYYWTDRLLSAVVPQVLMSVPLFRDFMSETAMGLMRTAWGFCPVVLKLWPIWLFLLKRWGWSRLMKKQQTEFLTKWKSKYCKEIWGDMSRENPCGGTAYQQVGNGGRLVGPPIGSFDNGDDHGECPERTIHCFGYVNAWSQNDDNQAEGNPQKESTPGSFLEQFLMLPVLISSGLRFPLERETLVRTAMVLAVVVVVLGSSVAFSVPQADRSSLRRLLLPTSAGLANMMFGPATAEELKQGQEVTLRIGDTFVVKFRGPIPRDDFVLGGGGDMFGGTQLLNNPKVIYVKKGGIAYGQGLRVGDEITAAQKEDVNVIFSEGELRRFPDIDGILKQLSAGKEIKGAEAAPGLVMEFRARGTVQPGDLAPDFKLPASTGGLLSLKELLEGNEYLVMFFRPSSRFRGGGLDEVKYFDRAQKVLAERGATIVGVQREPLKALETQSKRMGLNYPLLCDYAGEVAKAYGAYIELEEQGPNTNRLTFIIGKDGFVKASFVTVGYDADKFQLQDHVADVVRVLGGDPKQAKLDMQPKSKSVGDMLEIALGVQKPKL
ncbi:Trmo [Symbiodinium natans]|uniref:Trmo protein n=1 Tax=Symbiodinium natans TaxID=878477 RepID=A0A812SYH8_9DINO|nr:Trmo [Symbiodinium natans]